MARIVLDRLTKAYDGQSTVHSLDLDVADGEFIVLVGPSGCGKSTTLRMIAGLEEITSGEVRIGDRVVNALPARDRDVAMVFQNYALYPHMTVYDNIAFGLVLRKTPKEEVRRRVAEAARILDLTALLERRPRALSGGQRQRVAMGRAMVRQPRAFLFDEPLSNLDAKLRTQMRAEIKRLHATVKTTTVYVTHDQVEAMTLADRVVVMNGGRIEQVATPQELYAAPRTRFVAGFIGNPGMNMIPARLVGSGDDLTVEIEAGPALRLPKEKARRYGSHAGKSVLLGLRPEHLSDRRPDEGADAAPCRAPVRFIEPMGMETLVHTTLGGVDAVARCRPEIRVEPGGSADLLADMSHAHIIDPETDVVL